MSCIADVKPEKNYFTTTYRDAQCDYKFIDNSSK